MGRRLINGRRALVIRGQSRRRYCIDGDPPLVLDEPNLTSSEIKVMIAVGTLGRRTCIRTLAAHLGQASPNWIRLVLNSLIVKRRLGFFGNKAWTIKKPLMWREMQ